MDERVNVFQFSFFYFVSTSDRRRARCLQRKNKFYLFFFFKCKEHSAIDVFHFVISPIGELKIAFEKRRERRWHLSSEWRTSSLSFKSNLRRKGKLFQFLSYRSGSFFLNCKMLTSTGVWNSFNRSTKTGIHSKQRGNEVSMPAIE